MSRNDIDRSLDGQLTPEEWNRLQRAVIDDPEVRREYVEKRWLHAQLISESESLASHLEESDPVASSPSRWLEIAAGIVLLGAALYFALGGTRAPTVATLVEAEGCRWEGSDLPTNEGAKLAAGTLALAEGMATIRFESGATVTLEAPSVLEVESKMRCRLIEGSVVADVPESAHGFTIDTEKMEVVDLGTRFGVTTSEVGGSHVFVFDGEVEVHRDETPGPERILGGKSLHLGASPSTPDQEVSRSAPPEPTDKSWTALPTSTGRGKDAYMRRGDAHGPTGGHPLVMAKHTDLAPSNERRAVLTFDLARIRDLASLEAARLTLKIESSGLGFSSLVPDSRFTVYGVLDEKLDRWSEANLQWSNGGLLVSEPLASEPFRRLGDFEIRKGASHTAVEISSDALVDFLRGQDDGLATFLIIRETGEHDSQGLVHAFASKEHPTSPAPTLWLKAPTRK